MKAAVVLGGGCGTVQKKRRPVTPIETAILILMPASTLCHGCRGSGRAFNAADSSIAVPLKAVQGCPPSASLFSSVHMKRCRYDTRRHIKRATCSRIYRNIVPNICSVSPIAAMYVHSHLSQQPRLYLQPFARLKAYHFLSPSSLTSLPPLLPLSSFIFPPFLFSIPTLC